jgi:hypothetical protein
VLDPRRIVSRGGARSGLGSEAPRLDHLNDLAPASDQIGEKSCHLVRHLPQLRLDRLGEVEPGDAFGQAFVAHATRTVGFGGVVLELDGCAISSIAVSGLVAISNPPLTFIA